MGLSRDSRHKRRLTGGRRKIHQKKRKYELARPPANTAIGPYRVHPVRVRGGAIKFRALKLENGNFSWASECCTRKTRIMKVSYHASNNELVRTNTLVRGSVAEIDATPFRTWYENYYGIELTKKKQKVEEENLDEDDTEKKPEKIEEKIIKKGKKALKKQKDRAELQTKENRKLAPALEEQLKSGRLMAILTSRPGQCGRADGYILEGKELEFYQKKIQKKKTKA